jgi:hypothetical protein
LRTRHHTRIWGHSYTAKSTAIDYIVDGAKGIVFVENTNMMQDRSLLRAALRVLAGLEYRRAAEASDIDLLRSNAFPEEIDLDLDDLARSVAQRAMKPYAAKAN